MQNKVEKTSITPCLSIQLEVCYCRWQVCQEKKETEVPQLFRTLCSSTVNAAVIFQGESQLWLKRIHRKLAGKRSIRHPYYCEIRREISAEVFNILAQLLSTSEFREPYRYVAGNKKRKER